MKYISNSELNRNDIDSFFLLDKHSIKLSGMFKENINFVIENQLCKTELWDLFVNIFITRPDKINNWSGEYFGKMMRAGAMIYRINKNEKLYKTLTYAVNRIINTQDEFGRISSYDISCEFDYWDMWCRKYILLGLIYFYDICKSTSLKNKIIRTLKKHANYIIKHIGKGKNKISIFETSQAWGGLNSASILEGMLKLYNVTQEDKYLEFSKYLVDSGLCNKFNLVEESLSKQRYPYQFEFTKAYEMMSCVEGLAEYYRITKDEKYKTAVINFVDMIIDSDVTVIGCCGTEEELFDNSKLKQTNEITGLLQETCVTVTWMKLLFQALMLTGNAKYANEIERSSFNAMPGALNTNHQHSIHAPHNQFKDEYTFDSYSPLVNLPRGREVGGYQVIEGKTSYGCCACIGSAGIAMPGLFGVMKSNDGIVINLYSKLKAQCDAFDIIMNCNLAKSGIINIVVSGKGANKLLLRMPMWSKTFKVFVEEKSYQFTTYNGYAVVPFVDSIKLKIILDIRVKKHSLNDKYYFTKGPFVLARDTQFNEDITKPVGEFINFKVYPIKPAFKCNIAYKLNNENNEFSLVDYASAGKNWDDDNSLISVFIK